MGTILADQLDRDRALNIAESFIVQAPAGSGKTELLTLRYLKLLSVCDQPEEVLAITFTRKAASEMRDRIIKTIQWGTGLIASGSTLDLSAAASNSAELTAKEGLDCQRLKIVRAVIERDQECSWHILDNPSRLRVQTIDSFCAYLARQLPILSQLGGAVSVSEDVEHCFLDAIANTIAELEGESKLADDVAKLLAHLDNDINKVEKLLIGLLYNRDQWLAYVVEMNASTDDVRDYLQSALEELINESIEKLAETLIDHESDVVDLINFAAANLLASGALSAMPAFENFQPLDSLPASDYQALPVWHLLVDMLLTKKPSWRAKANKNQGFPAADKKDKEFDAQCKQMKQSLLGLRESLQQDDALLEDLDYLRKLPNPTYQQEQWAFLSALTRVLAHLSSQLLLSFRKFRLVDYAQTGAAARTALGSEEAPTDLALALDHRIQHILVDEFQDTSKLQLEILQQLTYGWQVGDGRSLFLVGDAMQSCYGFRNANVGIYLSVKEHGLGSLTLHCLTLQTNFRSQDTLVKWVNSVFSSAFPRRANSSRGAVPYTDSVAVNPAIERFGIDTQFISYGKGESSAARELEAVGIVAAINDLQGSDPGSSIAVLVRSRSHLDYLIPKLREANIQWQATDIDRLRSLPIIEDLMSLCRAILNPADRLAWLSILRAPWCGLTVADLHAISHDAGELSIWSALQCIRQNRRLSQQGSIHLQGFMEVMRFAMEMGYRRGLRQVVEASWTLLRGFRVAQTQQELDSASHFFNLLAEHERAGGLNDVHDFQDKLARAFVPSAAIQSSATATDSEPQENGMINLLTMHKAKGLEFDHVILPGLANKSVSDDKSLLLWHERFNQLGQSRLFLAALSPSGADDGLLYQLLRHERQCKSSFENTRLLYIAMTRARKSIKLFATLPRNSRDEAAPAQNSLLQQIWPALQEQAGELKLTELQADEVPENEAAASPYPEITPVKRLHPPLELKRSTAELLQWQLQKLHDLRLSPQLSEQADSAEELAGPQDKVAADISRLESIARLVGTLLHRALEAKVKFGLDSSSDAVIGNLRRHWSLHLRQACKDEQELEQQLNFIQDSFIKSTSNSAISWIFDPDLEDSRCELKLSSLVSEGISSTHVIDRSFISADGTRWIIDYKSAAFSSATNESDFIDAQCQNHTKQLRRYRSLFEKMEDRPVKTALLFTSIPRLVEVV